MSAVKEFLVKFKNCSDKENQKKFLDDSKPEDICETIIHHANSSDGLKVWSSVIDLMKHDEENLLEIVKDVLPKLNPDFLSTKILDDFYSRLGIELPHYSLKFTVKLGFFCENSIQFGGPRACFFKDILPCVLNILGKEETNITIDGVRKLSGVYQQELINSVLSKPFKVSVLTALLVMFKDIKLNKDQTELLLGKICDNMQNVHHQDISGLALASFNLALFNRLIIPVLALDTYFYNKRYKSKFDEFDSESDIESIDETSEKGIIETEENVIFHFQHVSEFTSIEKDIVTALKPLAYAPKFILSPFIATILVSFAKMSSSSVSGNLRLPQSDLLPFMKQVFKNNEKHRLIRHESAWARTVDKFEPVDIDKLLKILQENTCKLGQYVALNGFIGLTFMLLKVKNAPALNNFAVQFLNELVKQRQEFASDIMKIVVKMLFSVNNTAPIVECFSTMIQNRALPIDRCEEALTDLIENLTDLELETALAIESVIYSAISKSSKLRDLMAEKMRAAMYQNRPEMRKLAVYTFCVMLKKVTKPNEAGTSQTSFAPSQNLSMMSLLSQSLLPSTEMRSMRRVSVLVLEILGILRKCFSHSSEIRVTLYESLLSAISANPFIIPNVLEFVEAHFREYFDSENSDCGIKFTKVFKQLESGEVVLMDDLGKFLEFFLGCLLTAKEKLKSNENVDHIHLQNYCTIIDKLIERVDNITMDSLDVFSTIDLKTCATISQVLNCIEALMIYCGSDLSSQNVTRIVALFDKHQQITKGAKQLQENAKKAVKRGKNQTAAPAVKIVMKLNCIWDLKSCGDFLKIVFEDNSNEKVNEIKQKIELVRFVVKSTSQRIAQLTAEPKHLKIKNSRAIFSNLKKISSILYKRMDCHAFKRLFEQFDAESAVALAEAFSSSIRTMFEIYNDKWLDFLKKLTGSTNSLDFMLMEVIKTLQKIVEWAFDSEKPVLEDTNAEKIIICAFASIQHLFKSFDVMGNVHMRDTYNWILAFCKKHEIERKNLHVINEVLFEFMTRQDGSSMTMEHIAHKFSTIYGYLDEDVEPPNNAEENDIKSITPATADQSLVHFTAALKKQIEDVDFCVLRINSFNSHVKIPGQDSRKESEAAVASLEQSCVVKLKQLGSVLGRLCGAHFSIRGNQTDLVGKVMIAYFTCLGNLMKHFYSHFDIKHIDYREIQLDILIKETKVVVKQVYALAQYVDDMFEEEQKTAETGKKKATRSDFKSMSRVVLMLETFSAHVRKFDGITKKNFAKYIHTGEIRDCRIEKLKESVSRPKETISQVSEDSEESKEDSEAGSELDEHEVSAKRTRSRNPIFDSSSDEEAIETSESPIESLSLEITPQPAPKKPAPSRKRKLN